MKSLRPVGSNLDIGGMKKKKKEEGRRKKRRRKRRNEEVKKTKRRVKQKTRINEKRAMVKSGS